VSIADLPTLNACLNILTTILLTFGFVNIKRGRPEVHKKFMVAALFSSGLFLIFYLIYHYYAGSVPYPYHDWTRPVYFAVLIPHVILAAVMLPFILVLVGRALRGDFDRHKRMARYVWPVWMFVSLTGVLVYAMLYLQ